MMFRSARARGLKVLSLSSPRFLLPSPFLLGACTIQPPVRPSCSRARQFSCRHVFTCSPLHHHHHRQALCPPSGPAPGLVSAPASTGRQQHTVVSPDSPQRLLVIQPEHKTGPVSHPYVPAECRLEEAVSLVRSIEGWEVPRVRVDGVRKIHNQTYFGTGKTAELKSAVRQLAGELTGVFINTPTLTPIQHRTLERVFRKEVYDRFGIVLHIFKERAHTREAKAQVELAEIPYKFNKMFGGLEEGGRGHAEAIGETPMASRKFAMKRRLRQLEEELRDIRAKRKNLRESRAKRSSISTVAVVGYTNAGKTTLIKALSHDITMVPKDMLFATLDSTFHGGKLPCGLPVLYVDTIGFISELPVELIESFAATLEDSIAADVLVHVIDGSHPQAYAQRADVVRVLEQLELRPHMLENVINVVNKADKMEAEQERSDLAAGEVEEEEGEGGQDMLVSATGGRGLSELQMRVQREVLRATGQTFWLMELPASGPHLNWLYHSDATVSHVEAAAEEGSCNADALRVWVVFSEPTLAKFLSKFSGDDVTMTPCEDHNFTMKHTH